VPLSAKDVAEIARLLEESDFAELHVEQDGLSLTLKRGATAKVEGGASATAPAAASTAATVERPTGEGPPSGHSAPAADKSVLTVTAPFVGIFYRAPKPGAPPYVEVGSRVEEDTIIGIIEVMKLMNAVRAEVRGKVLEILVEDGAVVEYGQVLLRIELGDSRG